MRPEATLPDWLAPKLRILSVGLNPSLNAVRAGFPFATPQNRFWKALNASGLVAQPLTPGVAAMQCLLERYRIGFTDVVKRATPGAAQLRVADFRRWAPRLSEKILACAPAIVWVHGKVAWRHYLKYSGQHADADCEQLPWGLQPVRIGISTVFVTPNPSPANASYSLQDLIAWYAKLAAMQDSKRNNRRAKL